jgi:O-antigen/teichoic acid export membrane protein
MTQQLFPVTTSLFESNDHLKLQDLLIRCSKYTVSLGSLIVCGIITYADVFCHLWLGSSLTTEKTAIIAVMIQLLMVGELAAFASGTQWSVLLGMSKFKFVTYLTIPIAILTIITSWFFLEYTEVGIYSVVYSPVFFTLIRSLSLIIYTSKVLRIPTAYFLIKAYLNTAAIIAIMLVVGQLAIRLMAIDNFPLLAANVIVFTITWCVLFWYLGMNKQDRDALRYVRNKFFS